MSAVTQQSLANGKWSSFAEVKMDTVIAPNKVVDNLHNLSIWI